MILGLSHVMVGLSHVMVRLSLVMVGLCYHYHVMSHVTVVAVHPHVHICYSGLTYSVRNS